MEFFEEQPEERIDLQVEKAVQTFREHFVNKIGNPIRTPYFLSQLRIFYENDYFPWVVSDALKQLVSEGFLIEIKSETIPNFDKLKNLTKMKFYVHNLAMQTASDRDKVITHAYNIAKLVNDYSDPENSRIIGKHLETLVRTELRVLQFDIISRSSREYNGKKWTETEHNLDIIAKHKTGNLAIGVEVKNTLDIIPPDEIDVKIRICEHLDLVPIFAVRWIKPYFECIRKQGGFSWMFKTQMYPLGYEKFTKNLFEKLSNENKTDSRSHPLQFPVSVREELPPRTIETFSNWMKKAIDSPPTIDSSNRCAR